MVYEDWDYRAVKKEIASFIQDQVDGAGCKGAVVGLSGGHDSSTIAYLCVEALGADRVLGVLLPSPSTPKQDGDHALQVVANLGIRHEYIDIGRICEEVYAAQGHPMDKIAEGNAKARVRMLMLYTFANQTGSLVVGTGCKSEDLIGYFTKYGDGGVDINPLQDLYKTQVRCLARELGVPNAIIRKPSSPALWKGQTAEGELGLSYEQVDLILSQLVDQKRSPSEVISQGIPPESVELVVKRMKANAHKLRSPPYPELYSKFGP
jgi:NAD+ synthase